MNLLYDVSIHHPAPAPRVQHNMFLISEFTHFMHLMLQDSNCMLLRQQDYPFQARLVVACWQLLAHLVLSAAVSNSTCE